jgi:hypothetical protein
VYFETQLENHCGAHALNNVFGERLCSRGDLEETLRLMEFEAQFPDAEFIAAAPFDASLHMDSSGNYSEELLAKFLATRTSYVLEFAPLTVDTVHSQTCITQRSSTSRITGQLYVGRTTRGLTSTACDVALSDGVRATSRPCCDVATCVLCLYVAPRLKKDTASFPLRFTTLD